MEDGILRVRMVRIIKKQVLSWSLNQIQDLNLKCKTSDNGSEEDKGANKYNYKTPHIMA